jgi:hypothetical protein
LVESGERPGFVQQVYEIKLWANKETEMEMETIVLTDAGEQSLSFSLGRELSVFDLYDVSNQLSERFCDQQPMVACFEGPLCDIEWVADLMHWQVRKED